MNRSPFIAAPLALILASSSVTGARADCVEAPASFAALGALLGTLPDFAEGDLLNARLLTSRGDACRRAWEIEALTRDGRIARVALEATTLAPIVGFDREDWFDEDAEAALTEPERETEAEIEEDADDYDAPAASAAEDNAGPDGPGGEGESDGEGD